MLKILLPIALLITALLSAPSFASQAYNFTYTPDANNTVTGAFTGTPNGDFITDLSNISVIWDNSAFIGNGSLFGSHMSPMNGWVIGGAYASFSGTHNNFMFIDSNYPIDPNWHNYIASKTDQAGVGSVFLIEAQLSNQQIYSGQSFYSNLTSWSVTPAVTTVPLPAPILMFTSVLLGLRSLRKKQH